ncbi:MAG TPA: DMT family transporter, partial [Fimbriimonadaceae bacterium]|nr:DMT family transporter [Fimbriimonadaceae bacterium]
MPLPRPNLPLSITVLVWGFNFVAVRRLYGEGVEPVPQMTAPSVALLRFLAMWGLLWAVCKWRGDRLAYPPGQAGRILLMGFLAMGLYMVVFLEGMRTSSAAEGAIILATAPVLTLLMAVLAKQERFQVGILVGSVFAFVGVCLVVLAGAELGEGKLVGNLLVLSGSFIWAWSTVVSRPLVSQHSPYVILTLSMPGALPILLPYGLADSLSLDYGAFRLDTWMMFAHVVVMAGLVGFIGFFEGVRQIGGPAAMLYQYFVPPIAALFAWLILGTHLLPLQLIGLGVVFLGVASAQRARTRSAQGE